ncbi:MAG TPA: methyltransferase domain-containing protein [Chloroflexota bacterium]|nr:methyltransferase domain-containing protein [Chloroflexota bacterium]
MSTQAPVDTEQLRKAIQEEYAEVAHDPDKGFHFHTGRHLAGLLEYKDEWLDGVPEENLASFAGVGKPFTFGALKPGERVIDIGSGAGLDSLIASKMVGPAGQVIGIDMTPAMLDKARKGATGMLAAHVEFREGYMEALPVEDGWADVVISNGVINLSPNKAEVWSEIYRVLKPGGRIQIADIVVGRPVPEAAKEDISLWTG